MKDLNSEILALLMRYHGDTKQILKENKKLEYLYALSVLRENLLEWFDFRKSWNVLQLGADYGALTGLLLERCGRVTVCDSAEAALETVRARWGEKYPALRTLLREDLPAEETFDCVTVIGTMVQEKPAEEQIREAQRRLAPGGTLILAIQNRYGMKFMAGTPRTETSVTREDLQRILPGGRFYYPMPDYRTASVIYSDGYLPQKGDFAGMPALYDTPKYQISDVGESLEQAVADGKFPDFANSFLVIWKAPDNR